MEIRIYKDLLNGKETIDTYTIWFKPTKKAAKNGALINALCCNIIGNRVYGYWLDFPANTRIGLDIYLGKRQKLTNVPKIIARHAEHLNKIWNEACKTGNWDKWNKV